MNTTQFKNLVHFFGGCFHQDWRLDDPTPESVVLRFTTENSAEFVNDVASELSEFIRLPLSECELRRILFEEFGSYYMPPENLARLWLTDLRNTLKKK